MSAKQHSRKATGGKSKGGGDFAHPTRASKLKQVTRASASQEGQEAYMKGANLESLVLLKNLAKLLVDRIEAACAARNTLELTSNSQVSNPNQVLNTATDSRFLHGRNPGSSNSADGEVPDPSVFVRRNENHGVGNSCQSQDYGSSIDVESCAVSKEKANSPYLSTQKHSGRLGDYRSSPCIKERDRNVQRDDAQPGLRGGRHDLELESHSYSGGTSLVNHGSSICDTYETFRPDSRPSSQANPSGSTYTTSEIFGVSDSLCPSSCPSSTPNQSGSSSRPPTREWTSNPARGSRGKIGNLITMSSRMLSLKKVNVGLDDCEMPRKKERVVQPTPRRKIKSPGLRSLVVPQVKRSNTPLIRPPANAKLVLKSSVPIQKPTEEVKFKEEPALKEVGNLEPEELYKAVWADVVHNVFDEVFRDEEEPSHAANGKPPPCSTTSIARLSHASEEWIFQTQSIKYRTWAPESNHLISNTDNQTNMAFPKL